MIWQRYFSKLAISALVACLPLVSLGEAAAMGPPKNTKSQPKKTKEEYRDGFFRFTVDLLRWAAKAKSMLNAGEAKDEIYFKFSTDDYNRLHLSFESHRETLFALSRHHDLNMINGQEVLPQKIYAHIKQNFALNSLQQPMDKGQLLRKLVGGELVFARGRAESIVGFLDKIEEFNLGEWTPVQTFINQFKDTLTLDSQLASHLGRVLLPLMAHYYNYMDTTSRLRLFKELAEDYRALEFTGQPKHDWDQLAIKVFQSSGPVLIKFLQQLQEETMGETPISRVLEGLKYSKPMPDKLSEKLTIEEVKKATHMARLKNFVFEPRALGIASIAQTHIFQFNSNPYIIKLLKDKVKDVFEREKAILRRILDDEKNEDDFDKGLKQTIENMISGIEEEINFNFERRNVWRGLKTYHNPKHGITTVDLPGVFGGQEAEGPDPTRGKASNALIMSVAAGEPLGSLMKRGNSNEVAVAYDLMQVLYHDYLFHALGEKGAMNFYHGDLHRENMFIDVNSRNGQGMITLIDFGNAGLLSPRVRGSIMRILDYTRKTAATREEGQDKAIVALGQSLRSFIIEENGLSKKKNSDTVALLNSFFTACFDPNGAPDQKDAINKQVSENKMDLQSQKKALQIELTNADGDTTTLVARIKQLQDDIDFSNALLSNCLNGVTHPLLTALAGPNTVSDKLAVVFGELRKNGIALPKEVIFFNKSKSLLEGILTNLAQKLEEAKFAYTYVEPEDIFDGVLREVGQGKKKSLLRAVGLMFKR